MKIPRSSTGNTLLDAALGYASRGWPVLPLAERDKRPLTAHGLKEANTSPSIIIGWWRQWPNANVGLRTGIAFDAFDIDGEEGESSLSLVAGLGTVPPGPATNTGRGQHWLYRATGMANATKIHPKLDWRGVNGYIVAPPSIHPNGHEYKWTASPDLPLTEAPASLTQLLKPYREPSARLPIVQPNKYDPLAPKPLRMVARSTPILQVAQDMGLEVRRSGSRWAMRCIFHTGDNEPSLVLYPDQNSFYCYGCGAWGDSLNLLDRRAGGTRGR